MKVLILPVNIASDISHKVRALRKIGIDARGLTVTDSNIQSADAIRNLSLERGPRFVSRLQKLFYLPSVWRMIAAADILHWVGDVSTFPGRYSYGFMRRINKPGVVQWMGSEIRIPDVDIPNNPFYKRALNEGYEYPDESRETSLANQRKMAGLNFFPLEFAGLRQYIDRGLFPKSFDTFQPIELSEYNTDLNAEPNARPVIFHSPSAPVAKGTMYVQQAIDRLSERYDFEFKVATNVPRREALAMMEGCDIFVDQLILGSHGYAAVEAMAFGKPVVCYINPEIRKDYPADLPIVNADPITIEAVLEGLITDAAKRRSIGQKSRAYAEQYHDDEKIAKDLVRIYREVIDLHKAQRHG